MLPLVAVGLIPILEQMRLSFDDKPCHAARSLLNCAWARGVTATQHSVQVADAGSNPAGSILQVCGEALSGEAKAEIPFPSNLTLMNLSQILELDRVRCTTVFDGSGDPEPLVLSRTE
jgi:hypothetical protein